jgi:glycosyl transferase family 25
MNLNDFMILVINLDRAPLRLQKITEQLNRLDLRWERLDAVDGRSLSLNDPALLDLQEFGRRHGKMPLQGELGCYVSHVRAFERFQSSPFKYCLILEDDVDLKCDLPAALQALADHSADWDLVKLSGVHRGTPVTTTELNGNCRLVAMLSKCTGASAYVINRIAVQNMTSRLLPMRLPFDHEYDRGWYWGLKVRSLLPYVALHDQQVVSTINFPTDRNMRFRWFRRLPAFVWRFGNAIQRLIYGLRAMKHRH